MKNLIKTLKSLKLQQNDNDCCKITKLPNYTNLEVTNMTTVIKMPINVTGLVGEYFLKYSSFWNIIKKLKLTDKINFIMEENQLIIIVNGTNFNIPLIKNYKYKGIFDIKMNNTFNIVIQKDKNFIEEIKNQIKFCSSDELRPILTGVNFEFTKNELKLIATDSHILHIKQINIDSDIDQNFIVPFEVLKIISKQKTDNNIKMTFNKDIIKIYIDNMIVTSRFITGKYPNYNAIIPFYNKTKIKIDRKKVIEKLNLIKDSVNKYTQLIIFKVDNNTMDILTDTETQKIQISKNNSDNFKFAVNYKKLLIILKTYTEKDLTLYINSDGIDNIRKPIILKNDKNLSLIMPVKIV